MIIVMVAGAAQRDIDKVIGKVTERGLKVHLSEGRFVTIIGVVGDKKLLQDVPLEAMAGVEKIVAITSGYKLASRQFKPENTVIDVGGTLIGGDHLVVMAGPCAVESREQLLESARIVKKAGADFLRGGAYKPRTSPYSFQGLGEEALRWLRECGDEMGMPVCTEVMDTRQVDLVVKYADVLQIGARNMQNFDLLREVGRTTKPVLLKRGLAATVKDWLLSAEYVLSQGNRGVILCERGIKTFEDSVRYSMDISSIPVARKLSHLPIIVDPSHAAGKRDFVSALACAGMAAGAHGIVVEVHYNPAEAQCDGPQTLLPEQFRELMNQLRQIAAIFGKKFETVENCNAPKQAGGKCAC